MSKICQNCWPICWFLKFSGQPVGHGKRSRIASGSVSIDLDSGWRKSSEGVLECWEWQPPAARPAPHYSRRIGWWCSKLPADWMGPCAGDGETKADGGHSLIKENRPRLRHIRSGMVDSWWLYSQSPVFSQGAFTQISEEKLSCWYWCRKMCTGSL